MALAIIQWRGDDGAHQEFDVEIGSNRFYAWGVGSGGRDHDGVRLLADRSHTSPLVGPLEPHARGRAVLRVPSDAFTDEHHHLQLLSFRDEELRGPASSDIVEVPWRWTRNDRSKEASVTALAFTAQPVSRPPQVTPPVAPMSHAQFFGALGGVISQLLPIVSQALPMIQQAAPVIGRLLAPSAPSAPAGSAAGAAAGTAGGAAGGDLIQLLTQLLTQVQRATPAAPAGLAAAPPTAAPPALAVPSQAASVPQYSHAAMAPLLAALPALMPLLQQVLTPQTVQTLIQTADPNRLLQTVTAGVMDAARIGQEATNKLHEHLRALNPGLGDDVLIPMIAAMSTTAAQNDARPAHRLSRLVRLALPDLSPVPLGGHPQVAFRQGDPITLPVSVDTPRPINRARLEVCLRDAGTLARVARRTWTLARVDAGRLEQEIVLPSALTGALETDREYLVDLALNWPGSSGLMGATATQLIRVVGEATFAGLDTGGTPIRLDDVDRDRDWWHRVYADTVEESSHRTRVRLDYDFRLLRGNPSRNRRTETKVDLDPVNARRAEGTLRAGLGVSLAALSQLAERLTGAGFDQRTIEALSAPSFARAFDRSASCQVQLQGRRGASVAVWVWPEVKVHQAFLDVIGDRSPLTGQVTSFETVAVPVPVPGLAHVLSTRSS